MLLSSSLFLHGLVLAWLLYPPAPQLLNPVSITRGENGNVLSRLYFPTLNPDDSASTSSESATRMYKHQRLPHNKLTWRNPAPAAKSAVTPLSPSPVEDNSKTSTLSSLGHGTPAGLPYGTLSRGATSGDEILPALPTTTSDPVVYPWELPTSPGNEVIEITIDERGDIVNKTVLQSLGPNIDTKCLAALEKWRFRPATRNGAAIASKQDAIFPFRARG